MRPAITFLNIQLSNSRADKRFEIVLSLYPHQCFSYGYSNTKEEGASSQPLENNNAS